MVFALPAIAGTVIELATSAVSAVIKKYVPDPTAQARMELEVYRTLQSTDLAQMEINKEEAKSDNIFKSGWRPAIGWVGAAAIAWQFLFKPLMLAFGGFFSEKFVTAVLSAPAMDENLWQLITAMLGLGAMRSYDKMRGTTR